MTYAANPNFKHMNDYDAALARFHSIKPWRGYSDSAERPIDENRAKKHMTIRLNADESVACRYHDTDVVTYHKDGRITLRSGGWGTVSTNAFMYRCFPHVNPQLTSGVVWFHAERRGNSNNDWRDYWATAHGYQMDSCDRLIIERADTGEYPYRIADGCEPEPFRVIHIRRAVANKLLDKHQGYRDFVAFANMVHRMNGQATATETYYDDIRGDAWIDILGHQEMWHTLIANQRYNPSSWATHVREAIYHRHAEGLFEVKELPYVQGQNQLKAARASDAKWGRYV